MKYSENLNDNDNEPMVVIILVNYNGYNDTVECVHSLINSTYRNYKIILVDNGSNDRDTIINDDWLLSKVDLLLLDQNKGFADGNNAGIKYGMKYHPDYFLLINNDTVVEKDYLSALVECAETVGDVGIVTGNIAYYSNKNKMWYSNGSYNRKTCLTKAVNKNETKLFQEVTFASGCLMLISCKCINKVGYLDTSFFMYSEDTDYCCRCIDSGLKIYWNPNCTIYHKVSASAGDCSDFQIYYLVRNNLMMIKRYGTFKICAYILRLYYCIKDIIKRRASIKAVNTAYIDFIKERNGINNSFSA